MRIDDLMLKMYNQHHEDICKEDFVFTLFQDTIGYSREKDIRSCSPIGQKYFVHPGFPHHYKAGQIKMNFESGR